MLKYLSIRSAAWVFILNPYIGFPYLIPSDIQPVALLFCLLFIRPLRGAANIVFWILSGFAFIGFALIISHLTTFAASDINVISSIRDFFPLIAPPIYFSAGVNLLSAQSIQVNVKKAVSVFLFIYFFGAILNISGFTSFISLVVGRAEFVGFGARGFTSFFPEPSRISEQVLLIVFLSVFLRLNLQRIQLILLGLCTIAAGSGQTLIVYFQLLFAFIFSYGSLLFSKALAKLASLRASTRSILMQVLFLAMSLIYFLTNSASRGFQAVSAIFTYGPAYLSNDLGIQIKITGLAATYASVREVSPFMYYPLLSYSLRESFVHHYVIFYSMFSGIQNPPFVDNVYTSFGQYPIFFGLVGTIFLFVFISLAFFSGLKTIGSVDKRRFAFLFSLLVLFSFLKVPASNPSAWIMLSSFFVRRPNDLNESLKFSPR